jgi:hypothetical protein
MLLTNTIAAILTLILSPSRQGSAELNFVIFDVRFTCRKQTSNLHVEVHTGAQHIRGKARYHGNLGT